MNYPSQGIYPPLLAATLLVSGLSLSWNSSGLAQTADPATQAGTQISNTATATYQDPNDPNTTLQATSNTVVVQVAEVAGITNVPVGVYEAPSGQGGTPSTPILPGDTVYFDFRVTNVGNDPTTFFIPGLANITGPVASQTVQVSYDNNTFTPVPSAGQATTSIAPNASVIVRVAVQVSATAASGANLSVTLGNTSQNDNTTNTQNQPNGTAGSFTDGNPDTNVYTIDNADGSGNVGSFNEVAGVPSNGEREASASQRITIGSQPQAFATVLKVRGAYNSQGTNQLTDDTIDYDLGMRVESTAPNGSSSLIPADLQGTTLQVNSTSIQRILVSDAIPTNTTLVTSSVVAPTGWQAVYTSSLLSTPAHQATWTTTPSGTVTRIGFIYNNTSGLSAAVNPSLPTGRSVTGMRFQVQATGFTGSTARVVNLAQLLGETRDIVQPTGSTILVYDESGDQVPNNLDDNGTGTTYGTGQDAQGNPLTPVPDGATDPTNHGVDNNNNNQGSGAGGEDNVYEFGAVADLVNGPQNYANAVGPTDNTDDFTNKSAPITQSYAPGATIDPPPVTFTNTVQNTTANNLSNVLLVPDIADTAFVNPALETIPLNGTVVTIRYGTSTAVYTYDSSINNFRFTSGQVISIPTLPANGAVDYQVTVDLPAGTSLSTDTNRGFSIPIYAFVDQNSDGRPTGDTIRNRTIDRVYTGFLKLEKDARILDRVTGQPLTTGATGGWTTSSTELNRFALTGNFIEYRIRYSNISMPNSGIGNTVLNANNVQIIEEGVPNPPTQTNNWAADNDSNGVIDTSNVVGTAQATAGTITFVPSGDRSGTTAASDVTRYINAPGIIIQPGQGGTFTFRRRIN